MATVTGETCDEIVDEVIAEVAAHDPALAARVVRGCSAPAPISDDWTDQLARLCAAWTLRNGYTVVGVGAEDAS